MMRQATLLFLSCLLTSPVIAEEEQIATVLQKSTLLGEPYSDANAIATLKSKTQVIVLQRKGGWYQIRSDADTGWLRMSRIRFGDGTQTGPDAKGLSQTLRFLNTGRSGASGVTVATGIRGLDAADVSNATPDHNAVARLDAFVVKPKKVRKFAESAHLTSQPLGYFKK